MADCDKAPFRILSEEFKKKPDKEKLEIGQFVTWKKGTYKKGNN